MTMLIEMERADQHLVDARLDAISMAKVRLLGLRSEPHDLESAERLTGQLVARPSSAAWGFVAGTRSRRSWPLQSSSRPD